MILFLYMIDLVSNIKHAAGALTVISAISTVIAVIVYNESTYEKEREITKVQLKRFIIVFSASLFFYTITPRQSTMYLMMGVSATQQAMETGVGKKALQLLENRIERAIKEELEEKIKQQTSERT